MTACNFSLATTHDLSPSNRIASTKGVAFMTQKVQRIVRIKGIIGCLVKVFRFDLRGVGVLDVLAGLEEDRAAVGVGRTRRPGRRGRLPYEPWSEFRTQVAVVPEGSPWGGGRSGVEVQLNPQAADAASSGSSSCCGGGRGRRGDRRRVRRQADAFQVASYGGRIGEGCDEAHVTPAGGTDGDIDCKTGAKQGGP